MISVIFPVFNREKFVRNSITSVLKQTYTDFELIVVDDGSDDSTVEIVESLKNEDSRIKLIKTSHKGVSSARNIAIESSKGEYIFFFDSDDYIHPELFKILLSKMDDEEINMSFCSYMQLDEQQMEKIINSPAPSVNVKPHFEEFSEKEFMNMMITESIPFSGAIGGRLFRKSIIDGILFDPQLVYTEDTVFLYEYALHNGKTAVCDEKLYYYLMHDDNSINKWVNNLENFEPYVKAFYLLSEKEEKRGQYDYALQWRKKAYMRLCKFYHFALKKSKLHAANVIKKKLMLELKQTKSEKWRILYIICFIWPKAFLEIQNLYYSLFRKE